jgi:ribosomal protein S18 acetylase RimI-like enzyme
MNYRRMQLGDYETAVALWRQAEGVKLRDADSREGVEKYLRRNDGLSFVAESDGKLVGTIMAGHDGKRGYIQHLAVEESCRRAGVATHLLRLCLSALANEGILKSHIHVLYGNELAKAFWQSRGWAVRRDIEVYSYINGGSENT